MDRFQHFGSQFTIDHEQFKVLTMFSGTVYLALDWNSTNSTIQVYETFKTQSASAVHMSEVINKDGTHGKPWALVSASPDNSQYLAAYQVLQVGGKRMSQPAAMVLVLRDKKEDGTTVTEDWLQMNIDWLGDSYVKGKQLLALKLKVTQNEDGKVTRHMFLLFEGGTFMSFQLDLPLQNDMLVRMLQYMNDDILIELILPLLIGLVAGITYLFKRRSTRSLQ